MNKAPTHWLVSEDSKNPTLWIALHERPGEAPIVTGKALAATIPNRTIWSVYEAHGRQVPVGMFGITHTAVFNDI